METNKKQLLERIKTANNVLVTVSSNPSVDQLSAAIGLTLMLNKVGKHATAVFSGQVPSTIEFLQPEKTLEKNTDSLRDFIIALDKSKADKLRYKVEDNSVRIFITPYRTSISQADLEFSQGDFNVEVVIALGVSDQNDLDKAIISHGRILHDATTISVTTGAPSTLGSINWADDKASSLCEMIAGLAEPLQQNLLDAQMATALMTGIVAQTDRFSNEKTSPSTMSVSAALMAAGANQQLVASKLEEPALLPPAPEVPVKQVENKAADDGSLTIAHNSTEQLPVEEAPEPFVEPAPEPEQEPQEEPVEEIHIDEEGTVKPLNDIENEFQLPEQKPLPEIKSVKTGGSFLPDSTVNSELSVGNVPVGYGADTDVEPAKPAEIPLLSHDSDTHEEAPSEPVIEEHLVDEVPEIVSVEEPVVPLPEPTVELPVPPSLPVFEPPQPVRQEFNSPIVEDVSEADKPQTLSELEAAVQASYDSHTSDVSTTDAAPAYTAPEPVFVPPTQGVDNARDAVSDALASINQPLEPVIALNAQPFDNGISHEPDTFDQPAPINTAPPAFTMPENLVPPTGLPVDTTAAPVTDPTAPPAVPPPFMPDMNGFDSNQMPPVAQPSAPQQPAVTSNPFNLPPA